MQWPFAHKWIEKLLLDYVTDERFAICGLPHQKIIDRHMWVIVSCLISHLTIFTVISCNFIVDRVRECVYQHSHTHTHTAHFIMVENWDFITENVKYQSSNDDAGVLWLNRWKTPLNSVMESFQRNDTFNWFQINA